jgi:hypothetical protein
LKSSTSFYYFEVTELPFLGVSQLFYIRSEQLSSASFPILYSLIVLSFDAIYSS